jgi:hypothetical protein
MVSEVDHDIGEVINDGGGGEVYVRGVNAGPDLGVRYNQNSAHA